MNSQNNQLSFNPKVSKLETQERKQRNYQHLKPAYEVMNWKSYAMTRPRNVSAEEVDRLSAKNSVRKRQSPSYYQPGEYQQSGVSRLSQKKLREQNLRLSGVSYNKRQEHANRIKQEAIRRVKMLQQKVLPLINNDKDEQLRNDQYGFGWNLKMEQKLVKIQNLIQNMKNQIEIKFQKRLIQMQKMWQDRIGEVLCFIQDPEHENISSQTKQSNFYDENERFSHIKKGKVQEDQYSEGHYSRDDKQFARPDHHHNQQRQNTNGYDYYRSGFQQQRTNNQQRRIN